MFDSSVGGGTILAAFGGKYQMSPTDVSVMKFPVLDKTTPAEMRVFCFGRKVRSIFASFFLYVRQNLHLSQACEVVR